MMGCLVRLRAGTVLAACAAVAGCSTVGLTTDKIDYGRAAPPRTLEVPPDLSQLPPEDRYAMPERGVATASAMAASRTQSRAGAGAVTAVAPATANARIEREGNQRWLVVDVSPEQAFNVVREYLPTIGLAIEREDPKLGIVETVWAENRAKLPQDIIRRTLGRVLDSVYSTGEQDKYRVRIERTAANTSEIFVSHRGMIEVYTTSAQDSTKWQPRPSDPEMEAELLQRLALQFAPPPPQATAAASPAGATLAAAPSAGATLAAAPPEGARLLPAEATQPARVRIDEPFDRAWRRVGLALDRGGFTVEDRDRARGVYFVRYLDPEVEQKQRDQQRSDVTVQDRDGKPDASATAGKILAQINQQLR
jgi:outer membrane protein assembly factor BamC